jgi:hypothetical protein
MHEHVRYPYRLVMLAIETVALLTVVVIGLVLVATAVVAIGVRQEEHYGTLTHGRAPGLFSGLTRVALGHYVRRHDDEPAHAVPPDGALPWYQRSSGPVRR